MAMRKSKYRVKVLAIILAAMTSMVFAGNGWNLSENNGATWVEIVTFMLVFVLLLLAQMVSCERCGASMMDFSIGSKVDKKSFSGIFASLHFGMSKHCTVCTTERY